MARVTVSDVERIHELAPIAMLQVACRGLAFRGKICRAEKTGE